VEGANYDQDEGEDAENGVGLMEPFEIIREKVCGEKR
jgi:hypothetical protein